MSSDELPVTRSTWKLSSSELRRQGYFKQLNKGAALANLDGGISAGEQSQAAVILKGNPWLVVLAYTAQSFPLLFLRVTREGIGNLGIRHGHTNVNNTHTFRISSAPIPDLTVQLWLIQSPPCGPDWLRADQTGSSCGAVRLPVPPEY